MGAPTHCAEACDRHTGTSTLIAGRPALHPHLLLRIHLNQRLLLAAAVLLLRVAASAAHARPLLAAPPPAILLAAQRTAAPADLVFLAQACASEGGPAGTGVGGGKRQGLTKQHGALRYHKRSAACTPVCSAAVRWLRTHTRPRRTRFLLLLRLALELDVQVFKLAAAACLVLNLMAFFGAGRHTQVQLKWHTPLFKSQAGSHTCCRRHGQAAVSTPRPRQHPPAPTCTFCSATSMRSNRCSSVSANRVTGSPSARSRRITSSRGSAWGVGVGAALPPAGRRVDRQQVWMGQQQRNQAAGNMRTRHSLHSRAASTDGDMLPTCARVGAGVGLPSAAGRARALLAAAVAAAPPCFLQVTAMRQRLKTSSAGVCRTTVQPRGRSHACKCGWFATAQCRQAANPAGSCR